MELERTFLISNILFTSLASIFIIVLGVILITITKKISHILLNLDSLADMAKKSLEDLTLSTMINKIFNFFKRKGKNE